MDEGNQYLIQTGRRLAMLRGKISQQELADLANIDKRTVQRIERGTLNPSLLVLQKIAAALEVPVAQLLPPEK